jgi:hypothetical protein
LYPLAELTAVAGCPFQYVLELGGHVPHHSEAEKSPWPKEQLLAFRLLNTLEKAALISTRNFNRQGRTFILSVKTLLSNLTQNLKMAAGKFTSFGTIFMGMNRILYREDRIKERMNDSGTMFLF